MIELSEVLYQWQKGQNITRIAASLGISRPTVRKYLNVAIAAGLSQQEDLPATEHVLNEIANAARPVSSPVGAVQQAISQFETIISAWLSEPDMTATQICRLLKERGQIFSYSSVKRYVRNLKPDVSRPVTVRLETGAGEQGQVDFGAQ